MNTSPKTPKPTIKLCPHCQKEIPAKAKKCPECQSDLRSWFSRHPILSVIGILLLTSMVVSSLDESKSKSAVESQTTAAFDVPSLVGLSLKDLESQLGTPSYDIEPTPQQLALGVDSWEKTWDRGDYSLMATYDQQTKKVTDLFLGADSDAAFEQFEDTDNILAAGNLSKSDSRYSVEFVKAKNGPGYTGAIVRPK